PCSRRPVAHAKGQEARRRRRQFSIRFRLRLGPPFAILVSLPAALRYENAVIVADGDYAILHGRFSGTGRPAAWIAADVVRMEDGRLAQHWDVLQDEATEAESKSRLPMFGDRFPA